MITARHQNIEQNNLLVRKGKTMIDDRGINEAIVRKLQELDRLIEYLEAQLKEAPFGTLRITHNKGNAFYYWRRDVKDICGTYMKKKDMAFICALAQKEYNTKLLHAAKEKRKAMEVFLTQNLHSNLEEIYEKLSEDRKKLVIPYKMPEEAYVRQWQEQVYESNPFKVEEKIFCTERGEYVRSKSEKILADKFFMRKIPYRYEYPLTLKKSGTVYPDFVLLNRRTRREYYWEHFGFMNDPEYCEKAVKKIAAYEKNGIYAGDRLILTFEAGKAALDLKQIDSLINKYLI